MACRPAPPDIGATPKRVIPMIAAFEAAYTGALRFAEHAA
jgi:hypothetical protein